MKSDWMAPRDTVDREQRMSVKDQRIIQTVAARPSVDQMIHPPGTCSGISCCYAIGMLGRQHSAEMFKGNPQIVHPEMIRTHKDYDINCSILVAAELKSPLYIKQESPPKWLAVRNETTLIPQWLSYHNSCYHSLHKRLCTPMHRLTCVTWTRQHKK